MFWGVTLESGKRYSQVVDTSYHLSMAALEPKHGGEPVMVMLEHGKAEFLLCTLDQAQTRQVPLDLNFVEGEEVTFFLNGKGTVHLTGYITDGLQDEDEDDGESSSSGDEEVSLPDEEEDEDEELGMGDTVAPPARRAIQRKKRNKPSLLQALNGDDSEEDSDFDVDQVEDATEDDDDNDEEDEEDSDDEEPKPAQLQKRPPLKRPALMALGRSDSKPTAEQTSPGPGDAVAKKKRKRNKKGHTDGATVDSDGPKSPTLGGPAGQGGTTLPGGIVCTDLRVGSGPAAKHGKSVHVYYTGRLANNQVFDSCRSGKAFCFRLGKNEVIKGWETGIQGMKVGGKRRLVIPPSQAYGSTRMGTIPPNSTLYFDVELKAVS